MKVKSESEVAQSCPTLSDPMDCSLSGSPSMGFSRQEYWGGMPLPSPEQPTGINKSELRADYESVTGSVVFDSLGPHGLYPTRLLCPQNFPGKKTGLGSHYLTPGHPLEPGIQPRSDALWADSLPSEPPGKLKYTSAGENACSSPEVSDVSLLVV